MGDTENLKLLLEHYPSIVRQAAFTAMGVTHESPEAVAELATLLREFALRHSAMCRARDQRN